MPNKNNKPLAKRMFGFEMEMTHAEGMTLSCAREWRRAETDPALFADLTAWDNMRLYVTQYRAGQFSREDARQCVGKKRANKFFDAVRAIALVVHLFNEDIPPLGEMPAFAHAEGGS
jgi:hypothetical protein